MLNLKELISGTKSLALGFLQATVIIFLMTGSLSSIILLAKSNPEYINLILIFINLSDITARIAMGLLALLILLLCVNFFRREKE